MAGQLGVLEGNAGDLKVGLPLQSIHDGAHFVRKPLRLNVLIEACDAAMDVIICRHASRRELVENERVFL